MIYNTEKASTEMDEIERIYASLCLDELHEWSIEVWQSNLNVVNLPDSILEKRRTVIKILAKLNVLLSREVLEATIVNDKVLSLLAGFILQLSPFATDCKMDDQMVVNEVIICIEIYFRFLSLKQATSYNIYHPSLYETSFQILTNIISSYSSTKSKTVTLCATSRLVLSGPAAALDKLFENFSLPEQYIESTLNHISNLFRVASMTNVPCNGIERALCALALSNDKKLVIHACGYLCDNASGNKLAVGVTYLNKNEIEYWERTVSVLKCVTLAKSSMCPILITGLIDRASVRKLCAKLINDAGEVIFMSVDSDTKLSTLNIVLNFMKHKNIKVRLNAMVMAKMILSCDQSEVGIESSVTKELLYALAVRTRDISMTIQASALTSLSQLFEGQNLQHGGSLLAPGKLQPSLRGRESSQSSTATTDLDLTTNSAALRRSICETIISNSSHRDTLLMSFKRNTTECVFTTLAKSYSVKVRKAVLHLVKALIVAKILNPDDYLINLFRNGCYDNLQSARQSAIYVFTRLVSQCCSGDVSNLNETLSNESIKSVIQQWLKILLPMVLDQEKSVREKAYHEITEQLLLPLCQYYNHHMYDGLEAIREDELEYFELCFGKCLGDHILTEKLTNTKLHSLTRHVTDKLSNGAVYWIILSTLFNVKPELINKEKIFTFWTGVMEEFIREDGASAFWSIKFIRSLVKDMPDEKTNLIELCKMKYLGSAVNSDSSFVKMLCDIIRDGNVAENKIWIADNYSVAQLWKIVAKISDKKFDDLPEKIKEAETRIIIMSMFYDFYPLGTHSQITDYLIVLLFEQSIPQSYAETSLLALGRICCVNHQEAERIVPLFGQLLIRKCPTGMQICALAALSDLCQVKTQLVDKFLDIISSTLEFDNIILVKMSLKMITNLLKHDFVKMRSSLLSRMLILAANDASNKDVRELATYCLRFVIAPRVPDLFYDHFTQVMILTTGATQLENPGADKLLSTQTQKDVHIRGGIFPGNRNRANRRKIYDFSITNMTDKQRIKLLSKLKFEVFAAPQRNCDISTASEPMVEVMHDAMDLVHHHPILQFSSSRCPRDDIDDRFEDDEEVEAVTKNIKFNAVRVEYIQKYMFAEFFDLRETMRLHRSNAQIYLARLMKKLIVEIPAIKDMDIKFKDLESELDLEIGLWEGNRTEEPVQVQMREASTASTKELRRSLNNSIREMKQSLGTPSRSKGCHREDVESGQKLATMAERQTDSSLATESDTSFVIHVPP